MKKLLCIIVLLLPAHAAFAKVTEQDVFDAGKKWANAPVGAVSEADALQDWIDHGRPPNVPGGKIDWSQMPAGSQCGSYVMTGGRTNVQVNCQGHNPKNSCPSGFTRRDFGYFEAGGGARMFRWCSKN